MEESVVLRTGDPSKEQIIDIVIVPPVYFTEEKKSRAFELWNRFVEEVFNFEDQPQSNSGMDGL